MSFEAEFDELFTVPITYEQCTGNSDGDRSYAAPLTVMGRFDPLGSRQVRTFQDKLPSRVLFLKATATNGATVAPTVADRITIPSGYPPPLQPAILAADPMDDGGGIHHYEVYL